MKTPELLIRILFVQTNLAVRVDWPFVIHVFIVNVF